MLILGGVAIAGIATITYLYFRIVSAYNSVQTPDQATSTLDNATANVPDINPADYQQQDDDQSSSGSTLGQNRDDAVEINGVDYVGSSDTGLYTSLDGKYNYDDSTLTLDIGANQLIPVDPSMVAYGYYDYDAQQFVSY